MKSKIKFISVSIIIVLAITILPGVVFAQAFEPLNSAVNSFIPSQNSDADQETLTFAATEDLQQAETTSEAENITAGIKPAMMWGWDTNHLFKGDKICMGYNSISTPAKWDILSPTTANITKKQSSPNEDEYLALRDDSNKPVSAYDAAFLIADSIIEKDQFDTASIFTSTQKYAASSIRGVAKDQLIYMFNESERRLLLRTIKSDEPYTPTGSGDTFANFDGKPMSCILNLDKLFLISACEFDAYTVGCDFYSYWFRSPYKALNKWAGVAYPNDIKKGANVCDCNGVRPAFNLDVNSVTFVSSCQYGKPSKVGSELSAIPSGISSEYKLTVTEPIRSNFKASVKRLLPEGRGVEFEYEGSIASKNEYISAVIKNRNDRILYYGKLAKSAGSGTVDVEIPSLPEGDYLIGIFSEECNDNISTDYSSNCYTLPIHVK
jgi:hypothetical protein